jgi:CRP-like cAMP-binding protein
MVRDLRHTSPWRGAPVSGTDEATDALAVLRDSEFLAHLPPPSLRRLVAEGRVVSFQAGAACYRSSDDPSRGGIVLEGLARVYVEAPDGRRLTVRYSRRGELAGLAAGLAVERAPVNVQAVDDLRILELPVTTVRRLAEEDGAFAWALAQEVSRRLLDAIALLADARFGTVRSRLARTLLGIASIEPRNEFVASVTHQALADSIGSVREVVARELAALEREGVVATARGSVMLLRPDLLAGAATNWIRRDA